MSGPLVAVTGPDTRWPLAWWFIAWALRRAGARPVRITPRRQAIEADPDALVISGGDDIDPGLYLPESPDIAPMDPDRDALEVEWIRRGLERGIPMLGICRGAQLINVVRGGRLHQDLRRMRVKTSNRRTPFARKTLELDSGSRIAGLMGTTRTRINSLHHQAISETGHGLRVVGRDLDGLTQAVEDPDHRFLFGVQWHPEYLPLRAPHRKLFGALVAAAQTPG